MNAVADEKSSRVTFAGAAAGALYDAINSAAGSDALDQLARALWRGFGDGAINDADAAALQSLIDRRRPLAVDRRGVGGRGVGALVGRFIPRQRARSHDRKASRDRRRTLGGSAVMPSNLRCHYTEGQRAVLCVIAGEVKHHDLCDLPIDKIAALAGVCRTTVQTTLHEARRLGHVTIVERPQPGRKSLTNIVRVASGEWLVWIKRGPSAHRPAGAIGSKAPNEKNLRSDDNLVNPTKSVNFRNRSGEKERWRGSGSAQSRWRRRA